MPGAASFWILDVARKRRKPDQPAEDPRDEAAIELRAACHDVESFPAILRRAAENRFGRDVLDLDNDGLLDSVGVAVQQSQYTKNQSLTVELVWECFRTLKFKYGFVERSTQDGGPQLD